MLGWTCAAEVVKVQRMRRPILHSLSAFLVAVLLTGCGDGGKPAQQNKVVVVYTPHGDLGIDVKNAFEAAHPGYTAQVIDLSGGNILPKLQAEKGRPVCDVWWGGATGDFRKAERDGLFEPYAPEWVKFLPENAKSPTGAWNGTYLSPEAIMFNEKKLKREDLPDTWEGLLDPKWKGKIVARDVRASATMKTIYGALVYKEWKRTGNLDDGFALLEKLHANTGYYAPSPEVMFTVLAAPESPYALTPWNQFDALGRKHNHGLPFGYVLPKETPVIVEPIAIVKGAPHPEEAKLFYDFVTSQEQLLHAAEKYFRVPARSDLSKEKLPEWMREMKLEPQKIDQDEFDKQLEGWIARWQDTIRSKPLTESK
ncbi:MAG: extracellular solute-binding protein [Planctomycetes bacterium]|nr:extracellular solute-binding protein [Planctomycetota bacterium]